MQLIDHIPLIIGREQFYIVENTLNLPKSCLKLIYAHLLYLVDVFFNRQSAHLWVPAVVQLSTKVLCSPT